MKFFSSFSSSLLSSATLGRFSSGDSLCKSREEEKERERERANREGHVITVTRVICGKGRQLLRVIQVACFNLPVTVCLRWCHHHQ